MTHELSEIKVETPTDTFTLRGRPCELSAFSHIPTEARHLPPHRTYFNVDKKDRYSYSVYDRLFLKDFGYEPRLLRCDREHDHARGLHVNDEEHCRTVPVLTSSLYGHRLPSTLDSADRSHGHVEIVKAEFYRKNGLNIQPDAPQGGFK